MRKRNHIGNWIFCSANAFTFYKTNKKIKFSEEKSIEHEICLGLAQ